ncbi:MAG: DUF1684 domain-containing protein [Candidatus Marinimicrobia bacterium]|nr:DUF1684 domain-containing protein [Candidatus Neomarinimicrobiota bacterium]
MLRLSILILIPIFMVSCGTSPNQADIRTAIQESRTKKDDYFSTATNSPIPENKRNDFDGLNYFPIDLNYRITTNIVEYSDKDTVVMPTTKDREQYYLRWGNFDFTIDGNTDTLQVYKPLQISADHEPYFFIPFYDETNNQMTYGGGRYLDIPVQASGKYVIDFNQAYNPYCAYDYERWSCPMPPMENRVDFPVDAGEKLLYKDEHH